MNRFLALFTVLAIAAPTQAHFIWLLPSKGPMAHLVFSDNLEPDANVPIAKIAQTKVHARSGKQTIDVKKDLGKDHYRLAFPAGIDALEVGAVCQYGVVGKKGDPFLLHYYAKTTIGDVRRDLEGWAKLPLEIMQAKPGRFHVLWQNKTVVDVELTALVPGEAEPRTLKRQDDGTFHLGVIPAVPGLIGLRAKYVEKKEGDHEGTKYKEIRHYSTWTFAAGEKGKVVPAASAQKADTAATKLLAEARAARAVWTNFPGFSADLEINVNGQISTGKLAVTSTGQLSLKLDGDEAVKHWTHRTIASQIAHRMPGEASDTPCAFTDKVEHHPSGRAIRVLNDELHSSYRIRDRQILEVNRVMTDTRFTITVLENAWTKEKQYVPVSYVVDTWELKSGALVNSSAFHNTWTRVGNFDLPATLRVVTAKAGELDNRLITFSNLKLAK